MCCADGQNIIDANNALRLALADGVVKKVDMLLDKWDFLQLNCAQFINSDIPGLPKLKEGGKSMRYAHTLLIIEY